jgi:RNA polymerase sigma-54 factor
MISSSQQMKLQQKLSPQQILLMRLLQVSVLSLEQKIKEEIEKNPLLEGDMDTSQNDNTQDFADDDESYEDDYKDEDYLDGDDYNNSDYDSYSDDDDYPQEKGSSRNNADQDYSIPFASEISFQKHLINQFDLKETSEKQHLIGLELIGNIDNSGYINRSLAAISNDISLSYNFETSYEEMESVLKIIQSLEPEGDGARNLQGCLSLQLHRIEDKTTYVRHAITIVDKHFELFTKKHYAKLMKKLTISEEELSSVQNIIFKLNPKPGTSISESSENALYIIPDFVVTQIDGELSFSQNMGEIPQLKINKYYMDMLGKISNSKKPTAAEKETATFIKENAEHARWFIDALKQRTKTLDVTMAAIIEHQRQYFLSGEKNDLKPMLLKDIANATNFDISTVSRIVNQKYVQTDFGTFRLKELFSKALASDHGEDVSIKKIKNELLELIKNEDKADPLSDEDLQELLEAKGYPLARRTITKYRETLKIPAGRLRKELGK